MIKIEIIVNALTALYRPRGLNEKLSVMTESVEAGASRAALLSLFRPQPVVKSQVRICPVRLTCRNCAESACQAGWEAELGGVTKNINTLTGPQFSQLTTK